MTAQRTQLTVFVALAAALILALSLLTVLGTPATDTAQAASVPGGEAPASPRGAPEAAPTAVNATYSDNATNVSFWTAEQLTESIATDGKQLITYETLDLSYTIDQALTPVNTTTLKIQYSNDGDNWADGATIVSNNTTDATGMVQLNNYGRYTRVYATLSGSDPVTATVLAVAK